MNSGTDNITPKQQSYIEVIGEFERVHGHAHVSEVARSLGISKPSVVQMLKRLMDGGLLKRTDHDICLTAAGRAIVSELGTRQAVLYKFMVSVLGMDVQSAAAEACKLEHIVSPAFLTGLRKFHKGSGSSNR